MTMQNNTQSTKVGIIATLQNIDSLTNFNEDFNDLGLNTNLETYSVKQELIRRANKEYKKTEANKQNERIADLEKTLEIKKELISTLI